MLDASVVAEIDRLVQLGSLSQRQIAAKLGISRGAVASVARGNHRRLRNPDEAHAALEPRPTALPQRCGRCGYRVVMPCLICLARAYRIQARAKTQTAPPGRRKRRRRSAAASRRDRPDGRSNGEILSTKQSSSDFGARRRKSRQCSTRAFAFRSLTGKTSGTQSEGKPEQAFAASARHAVQGLYSSS